MLSVGEILKNKREKLNISLEDIEKFIKIRKKFLAAVEENNWSVFSSKVYIEGIIKNYSRFLELDSAKTLSFFRRDYERLEQIKFKRKVSGRYFTPETRKIVVGFLIFIFLVFFGYFGYQLKLYFSPPKILITSPAKDKFTKEDRIKIKGITEKDTAITIEGERVYQNPEGEFEFELPLHKGKNELVIEAVGANGRKTIIKKIYERTD